MAGISLEAMDLRHRCSCAGVPMGKLGCGWVKGTPILTADACEGQWLTQWGARHMGWYPGRVGEGSQTELTCLASGPRLHTGQKKEQHSPRGLVPSSVVATSAATDTWPSPATCAGHGTKFRKEAAEFRD